MSSTPPISSACLWCMKMNDRLQAIIDRQRAFDAAHDWDVYDQELSDDELVKELYRGTVHLLGELGEFANDVKKSHRESILRKDELREELTDTFIYLLKLSLLLDMDLDAEHKKKVDKNYARFIHHNKD